jgi:hypothetical protein
MNDLKDWPATLKRNAALCDLAKHIYRARGEVYGGSLELSDEPPSVRQDYITRADELLKTLAPRRCRCRFCGHESDELRGTHMCISSTERAQFYIVHPEGD